jgi:anti-sigma factor ChrR (cupin superfamily)
VVDTHKLSWQPSSIPGVTQKNLYQQPGFSDHVLLERWSPQAELGSVSYELGAELFVLEGEFSDEAGTYGSGCWLRFPVGSRHRPRTARGCSLYVKKSGLPYLRAAVA